MRLMWWRDRGQADEVYAAKAQAVRDRLEAMGLEHDETPPPDPVKGPSGGAVVRGATE